MAQPPRAASNGDNFVRYIVADPKNVPDELTGYPRASSEESHEHLWTSPITSKSPTLRSCIVPGCRRRPPARKLGLQRFPWPAGGWRTSPAGAGVSSFVSKLFAGVLRAHDRLIVHLRHPTQIVSDRQSTFVPASPSRRRGVGPVRSTKLPPRGSR